MNAPAGTCHRHRYLCLWRRMSAQISAMRLAGSGRKMTDTARFEGVSQLICDEGGLPAQPPRRASQCEPEPMQATMVARAIRARQDWRVKQSSHARRAFWQQSAETLHNLIAVPTSVRRVSTRPSKDEPPSGPWTDNLKRRPEYKEELLRSAGFRSVSVHGHGYALIVRILRNRRTDGSHGRGRSRGSANDGRSEQSKHEPP